MRAVLTYLILEIRRALRRLPQVYAGAAVLLFFLGTAAFLTAKLVQGDAVSGRVCVGVILPEGDKTSGQVVSMLSSLPSVKSLCDFTCADRETCLRGLKKGDFAAVLDVPAGFAEDILDGTNTPVPVLLPENAGAEGKVFASLAASGAETLSASQAGIYAMDELCRIRGREECIPQAEADLNDRFLDFSLSRLDDFETVTVRATGDLTPAQFYGVSLTVLLLQLSVIPAAGYFTRIPVQTGARLTQLGAGPAVRSAGRILGTASLLFSLLFPAAIAACARGLFAREFFAPSHRVFFRGISALLIFAVLLLFVVFAAAAFVSAVFALAGSPSSGVMLLFFLVSGLHLLAGGILPSVFLPARVRAVSSWLPPALLGNALRPLLTGELSADSLAGPAGLFAAGILCCMVLEGKEQ